MHTLIYSFEFSEDIEMKKTLLAVSLSFTLVACSGDDFLSQLSRMEQWTNYDSQKADSHVALDNEKALAIFYRTPDVKGGAMNIYIEGEYQGALLDSSYTSVSVCANAQELASSFVSSQQFGHRPKGIKHSFSRGTTEYIKVVLNEKGEPTFVRVDEAVAKAEMATLKGKSAHTLSRVTNKSCSPSSVKSSTSNVLLTSELPAWKINKSSYRDMRSKFKVELKQFARKIKAIGVENIAYIEVKGYADPKGTEKYNLALSQERAKSISMALKSLGIQVPVKAVGLGKSNFIVEDCGTLHAKNNAAMNMCNQPNRRVEISVVGK